MHSLCVNILRDAVVWGLGISTNQANWIRKFLSKNEHRVVIQVRFSSANPSWSVAGFNAHTETLAALFPFIVEQCKQVENSFHLYP